MLGGIFWAMTAISYRRNHACAGTGRREAKVAANRSPALMRWAEAATYAFYCHCRTAPPGWAWALGVPLGTDQERSGNP